MCFHVMNIIFLIAWRVIAFLITLSFAEGGSWGVQEFIDLPVVDAIILGWATILTPDMLQLILIAGCLRALAIIAWLSPDYLTRDEIKSVFKRAVDEFEMKQAEAK